MIKKLLICLSILLILIPTSIYAEEEPINEVEEVQDIESMKDYYNEQSNEDFSNNVISLISDNDDTLPYLSSIDDKLDNLGIMSALITMFFLTVLFREC